MNAMSDINRDNLTQDDAAVDALMRRHFAAELDNQRGRCTTAFRRHVLTEGTKPVRATRAWFGPWAFGAIGAALAASIAVLVGPGFWRAAPQGDHLPGEVIDAMPVVRVDQTVRSHFLDGGAFMSDEGIPVRRVRRIDYRRVRWHNETTGEQIEQLIPVEDEMLIELKTY